MTNLHTVDLDADVQAGLAGVSDGDVDGEQAGVTAGESPKTRPRARAKARALPVPDPVPLTIDPLRGHPPAATHWAAKKRNHLGEWEVLMWSPEGTQLALREWPISELSESSLYDRWGAGDFKIQWVKPTANNGRQYLQPGREVRILPRVAPVAPPAEVAASIFAGPVGEAFNLMQMFEKMQDAKQARDMATTAQMMQMMQAMGGGGQQRGGLGAAELELIMRNSREATLEAVRASVEPLKAEIAAMKSEDEGGGGLIAGAAEAAGPMFTGKAWYSQAMRLAAAKPELAEKAIEVGLPALVGLATTVLTPILALLKANKETAPARPVAQPRQQLQASPPVAPVAPPVDTSPTVEAGSLSEWPSTPRPTNGAAANTAPMGDPPPTVVYTGP